MSGRHLTQSEYALYQIVVLFGELLHQLEEAHLTNTDCVVFGFCKLENIDHLVLRFLNTVEPPFNKWAEEWLHNWQM
jgi:hypothetical protein